MCVDQLWFLGDFMQFWYVNRKFKLETWIDWLLLALDAVNHELTGFELEKQTKNLKIWLRRYPTPRFLWKLHKLGSFLTNRCKFNSNNFSKRHPKSQSNVPITIFRLTHKNPRKNRISIFSLQTEIYWTSKNKNRPLFT